MFIKKSYRINSTFWLIYEKKSKNLANIQKINGHNFLGYVITKC